MSATRAKRVGAGQEEGRGGRVATYDDYKTKGEFNRGGQR